MAKTRASWRTLKSRRTYDVAEAARAVGVSAATVRAWRKVGLEPVRGVFPTIFRGVDLIEFLKSRLANRKHPSGPGRMFCFTCKEPQAPAFGEAEYWPTGPRLGVLRGLCPVCTTVMQRRSSLASLDHAKGNLTVTIIQADPHIGGIAKPC